MGEFLRKISSRLDSGARRRIITAAGALGLLLIFLSGFLPSEAKKTESSDDPRQNVSVSDDYGRKELERELGEMISAIEGAGHARVFITMDTTAEDIYAVDRTESESAGGSGEQSSSAHTEENEYVKLRGRDGSEQAVLKKRRMPEIRGVLIVCDGGGSSVVKEKITAAAAGALGVAQSRVVVTN